MIKQPDQQFYDACFQKCLDNNYSTYPYKPLNDIPYPFIEVGDALLIPKATKSALLGSVSLTLHIWCEGAKRRQASDIINTLLIAIKEIRNTETLRWLIPVNQCNMQIMQDTSTGTVLWHGVLEVTAQFY